MELINEITKESLKISSETEINKLIEGMKTLAAQVSNSTDETKKEFYYLVGYSIEENKEVFKKVFPNDNIYKKIALQLGKSDSTIYRCHQFYKKFKNDFSKARGLTWRKIVREYLPEVPNITQVPDAVIIKSDLVNLQKSFNYLKNHKYFLNTFLVVNSKPNMFYIVGTKDFNFVNSSSVIIPPEEADNILAGIRNNLEAKNLTVDIREEVNNDESE
jgi:hypothetical protein